RVLLSGGQDDLAAVLRRRMIRPVINDELIVDPEPHAVVRKRIEGELAGTGCLHEARPARAPVDSGDSGRGRPAVPVEVDGRVYPGVGVAGEVNVVIIGRRQAVAVPGVDSDEELRGRNGAGLIAIAVGFRLNDEATVHGEGAVVARRGGRRVA